MNENKRINKFVLWQQVSFLPPTNRHKHFPLVYLNVVLLIDRFDASSLRSDGQKEYISAY